MRTVVQLNVEHWARQRAAAQRARGEVMPPRWEDVVYMVRQCVHAGDMRQSMHARDMQQAVHHAATASRQQPPACARAQTPTTLHCRAAQGDVYVKRRGGQGAASYEARCVELGITVCTQVCAQDRTACHRLHVCHNILWPPCTVLWAYRHAS